MKQACTPLMFGALFAAALPATHAGAQCTPVNCLSQLPAWGGLCTDTFATGRVSVPYFDALSFHVTNACVPASLFDPSNTTASVRITQMSNFTFTQLPAGLTGGTNQATYVPPANGCGFLTGTPTQAGVFPATVNLLVNVNVWPFTLTCTGIGPLPQNNNPVSFPRELIILPDPSFSLPAAVCDTDAPLDLVPQGTLGGTFSGPGVSGNTFDPALAGVGTHVVKYVVSAQQGAAIAPATDSLEVTVVVEACTASCDADAGTLVGPDIVPCLEPGGTVDLFAIPGGDAVVPPGFEVVYVLTSGPDLVIQQLALDPVFTVDALGLWTIHTLVYDPNTLDLGTIEPGVTTGSVLVAQLVQGGGSICASLDVQGAPFDVMECMVVCEAQSGGMIGGGTVCLEGGIALLEAQPDGTAFLPPGYDIAYVLTLSPGGVILALGLDPVFFVGMEGQYTIHAFVYDPATFDLGTIEPEVTSAADLNASLVQGGGDICAALDLVGATFEVDNCTSVTGSVENTIAIHPNPNDGRFSITAARPILRAMLVDAAGREVLPVSAVPGNGPVLTVAVPGLAPGLYILRVLTDAGWHEHRVMVAH